MKRFVRSACVLGCASLLLVLPAAATQAQATASPTADILTRIRGHITAKRFSVALTDANGLLESTRSISSSERLELWQLLAAAYYPEATDAQQPDSARLPLAALIRTVPDIKIARDLSWPGLDKLTERVRAESFAVATRPDSAYTLSANSSGHITAVASRPTRFVLSSVDAGGRTVFHDSSAFATVAALKLRTHDTGGPIFTAGTHQLHVWAYDSISGDSLRLEHRALAVRNDVPAPRVVPSVVLVPSMPVEEVVNPTRPRISGLHRSAMLVGGVALAAGTVVIAQVARPHDAIRSAFKGDVRAYAIGAAMVGAAVANFFMRPAVPKPVPRLRVAAPVPVPVPEPLPAMTYQVRLRIDPPVR